MFNFVRAYLARLRVLYNNQLDYHRAWALWIFNVAMLVFIAFHVLDAVVVPILVGQVLPLGELIISVLLLAVTFFSQQQLLSGHLYRAGMYSVGMVVFIVVAPRLNHLNGTDALLLLLPITFAGVFLDRLRLLAVSGIMLVAVIYIGIVQNFSQTSVVVDYTQAVPNDLAVLLLGLGLTLLLMMLFASTAERLASKALAREERIHHLRDLRTNLSKDRIRFSDRRHEICLYADASQRYGGAVEYLCPHRNGYALQHPPHGAAAGKHYPRCQPGSTSDDCHARLAV